LTPSPLNLRRHLTLACYLLVGVYLLFALYLLSGLTGPGRYYRSGVPAGSDFLRVWSAASLASQGQAAQVYDSAALKKVEVAVVGGDFSYAVPFHYPPSFLWLIRPLSSLPYLAALAVWLLLPLAALLWLLYRTYPDRLTVWLALASIATVQNLSYGQGAFLVAFLLGGGLLLLDHHPLPAGLAFSLVISYKPHLGFLILVALLAGRRWWALGALIICGAALVLASGWALGPETWLAFWHDLSQAPLEMGQSILWDRMPTVFGAARLSGGGAALAWLLQIGAALAAALAVYWVWRGPSSLPLRSAVLVLGILLATPYAFNYDLTLLLLPLAWMAREELPRTEGIRPVFILSLAWLIPFLDLTAAELLRVHPAPVLLAVWLLYLLGRAFLDRRAAAAVISG